MQQRVVLRMCVFCELFNCGGEHDIHESMFSNIHSLALSRSKCSNFGDINYVVAKTLQRATLAQEH